MHNLTIEMLNKLKDVGFSLEELDHDCGPGMVYYYNNVPYVIGGKCIGFSCSEEEERIARDGIWLPDISDLMYWLEVKADYNVTINYMNETRYFYGMAVNADGVFISGSGPDLLCCLYKLIFKICRHNSQTLAARQ